MLEQIIMVSRQELGETHNIIALLKHQIYFFVVVVILLHFYLRLHNIFFLLLHTILLPLWPRTKITVIS